MTNSQGALEAGQDPRDVLGVRVEAGAEEIRAAYLRKVKEYPPDRRPEQFERIRDAYELLSDPRRRARLVLECPSPLAPLATLLDEQTQDRLWVGPEPWLSALKEKKRP